MANITISDLRPADTDVLESLSEKQMSSITGGLFLFKKTVYWTKWNWDAVTYTHDVT